MFIRSSHGLRYITRRSRPQALRALPNTHSPWRHGDIGATFTATSPSRGSTHEHLVRAFVRLRLPDGALRDLSGGDIIGRAWSAALPLNDPAVSEAHALVSLRGAVFKLLSLRGRFAVDGQVVPEVELVPGLRVHLTRDLYLEVDDLVLPEEVLALSGDGLAPQVLQGVCHLRVDPRPELHPGFAASADAFIWSDGLSWMMRLGQSGAPVPVDAGTAFEVGGRAFRFETTQLGVANHAATVGLGGVAAPLHLVVRYDTVHLHRDPDTPVLLDGLSARIVSELAIVKVPLSWEALARDLWPDEDDVEALRGRWDMALTRLRKKLRTHRVRADLVRADGTGNYELFLTRGDTVDDQT